MALIRLPKDRIYFKIVKFFHENPTSIDTPRGISTWIGENIRDVRKVLSKLVKLKILNAHEVTSTTGYSYTTDAKLIKEIKKILVNRSGKGEEYEGD